MVLEVLVIFLNGLSAEQVFWDYVSAPRAQRDMQQARDAEFMDIDSIFPR